MSEHQAKFEIGQVIHHRLFDYTGVVFDVDAIYQGTEDWYENVARSRPPKNEPWYHVLVDDAIHTTYVAEQNLEYCETPQRIDHPSTDQIFSDFDGQRYRLRQHIN